YRDIGSNLLRAIRRGVFQELEDLKVLGLRSNKIHTIEADAFRGLKNLTFLYLHDNRLTNIRRESFRGLHSLQTLFLNGNPLSESDFAPDTFDELTSLKTLKLDQFIICCYAISTIPNLKCHSPDRAFSTCDDLMKNNGLRMSIWILGLLAFIGNLLVIIVRIRVRDENKVQSFILTNLACADFLMGVYLLIIAIKDLQWKGEYFKHDVAWRKGNLCQFAGALSMLSSEVSVLMLLTITIDRLICVVFALRLQSLSLKSVRIFCCCIWIIGIIISFIPWTGISYFNDEFHGFGFFGSSAVCLPLQFSEDKPAGWEYATVFFIVLNSVVLLCIMTAYVLIFWTAFTLINSSSVKHMKAESTKARRLFFIVLTDFLCWMPIIIIGILSLTGNFHDPKHEAKVWIAVFVLPVNSAINPILYTFSTLGVRRKLRSALSRRFGGKFGCGMCKQREPTENLSMQDTVVSEHRHMESVESPQRKLHIIEKASGFYQDDDIFYFVAKEMTKGESVKVLLKCFSSRKRSTFENELEVVKCLPQSATRNDIPALQWYSKANVLEIHYVNEDNPRPNENISVLCYKYIEGISLLNFMEKNRSSMSLFLVYHLALDIIRTLEYLHEHGVNHNDIIPANIFLTENPGIPRWRATLINFDRACKGPSHANDVRSFGDLLHEMAQRCSEGYQQVSDSFPVSAREANTTAAMVRLQLEDAWGEYLMETRL
ncbi:G-protein coupled receptor GRL101-like, partial [Stylophora pistillata]|uniref:G-protein coupled receptor GRL101-like n=1 Tax=Stylophora pistillata TaxID=50429 RepID=UPI000C04AAA3